MSSEYWNTACYLSDLHLLCARWRWKKRVVWKRCGGNCLICQHLIVRSTKYSTVLFVSFPGKNRHLYTVANMRFGPQGRAFSGSFSLSLSLSLSFSLCQYVSPFSHFRILMLITASENNGRWPSFLVLLRLENREGEPRMQSFMMITRSLC